MCIRDRLKEADPAISKAYKGRVPHLLSLQLVPEPLGSLDQVIDLSDKIDEKGAFTIDIPKGKYALYSLVRIDSFGAVICGAPGAQGPTLNHLDQAAVEKYLNHMSDAIQDQLGPLRNYIRSLFTDSMELEGANWTGDFAAEFKKRRGYDIMPYLQYTMFKTGGMGNVTDYNYAAEMTLEFKEMIDRMRYDVELTKAEMFRDRFTIPYTEWCKKLGVLSRAQAYGRGFFPLESGMYYDIPEGESWTTNWLQHRIGEEMRNDEYRAGRAYTMINKYITSAAHLTGKRLISAEEMTNTYRVFNATPEFLKIGCDQNAQVGVTHSVWHGFNYSPAETEFPGWVRYGSFYNEKNNWWPYFNYLNTYRARVSSQLQNADMYADIAILMPVAVSALVIFPAHTSSAVLVCLASWVMMLIGRVRFGELMKLVGWGVAAIVVIMTLNLGRSETAEGRVSTWIHLWTKSQTEKPIEHLSDTERSMIAIYNGGILGEGAGQSAMRVEMIHPESDYAYAFFVEEYGFILAVLLLMLYLWVFFRGIEIFRRCGTAFPGLLVLGLALLITCQALLHIMVTVNLIPETGQTLPLISRGGSSMLFTMIAFGMILSVSRQNDEQSHDTPRSESIYEK